MGDSEGESEEEEGDSFWEYELTNDSSEGDCDCCVDGPIEEGEGTTDAVGHA